MRVAAVCFLILVTLLVAGCATSPRQRADTKPSSSRPTVSQPGGYYLDDGPGVNPPADFADAPDAIPIDEPLHRGANRPYIVFGKTYVPNVANDTFKQTGVASWYGRKFHGQKTSNGEIYDMYGMTAAHPTLPIPSYARVTNPTTGKSVVVRVNDRGPFHSERIIDLSYTAAYKLGIAGRGSGIVMVERVFPGTLVAQVPATQGMDATAPLVTSVPEQTPLQVQPLASVPTPISTEATGVFIQLGAFSGSENAESFRDKMKRDLDWMREPISVWFKDGLHRVRIGPLANREEAQAIAEKLRNTMNISPLITQP
jgi:peptidoglycan lytic transglycosylase